MTKAKDARLAELEAALHRLQDLRSHRLTCAACQCSLVDEPDAAPRCSDCCPSDDDSDEWFDRYGALASPK